MANSNPCQRFLVSLELSQLMGRVDGANNKRASKGIRSALVIRGGLCLNYLRREGAAPPVAAGSLISCPLRSSASAGIPFRRATSFISRLRADAILVIVSPFRALILESAELSVSAPGLARRQLVRRTVLLGTTNLLVDFRSTPPFMACNWAVLNPVRLATFCKSSPGAIEMTRALSRRSPGIRLRIATSCFDLFAGTRKL